MKPQVQYLEKVAMEKNETFECLVIKKGSIKQVSWFDTQYARKLTGLDLFESSNVNADNLLEFMGTSLEIKNYTFDDIQVKTELVAEEPGYVYELLYVDLEKATDYQTESNLNELATLLNVNGDSIYSTAILFKNYLPSLSDSMTLCSVTRGDVERILHDRVHTKVVIYDEKYTETVATGDLTVYAEEFFDVPYKKIEIAFLMHNINIWYTTFDNNKGSTQICGKLIPKAIDQCIWFTMKTDEFRGNLTLDEVRKIIHLSNKLTTYVSPPELIEEKVDSMGRKIIFNKYKMLDYMYSINQ